MSRTPACTKLRNWRVGQQLSQVQAADELGVARRTWHQWEMGATIPSASLMIEIFELTRGAVQPNDFYDLPTLVPNQREAA